MIDLTGLAATPAPSTTRSGARLLAAASDLFYDQGINAVGVDLIAERAATTKRTLYQRFGSKDGLVTAYLQQRAHDWQTSVLAALRDADPPTPSDALAVVLATAARWAGQNPRGCAFVNAWAELGSTGSKAVDVVVAEKRWMRRLFERLLGDDGLAAQVQLVYEGAQVIASTLGDRDAYMRATATCLRLADGSTQPRDAEVRRT